MKETVWQFWINLAKEECNYHFSQLINWGFQKKFVERQCTCSLYSDFQIAINSGPNSAIFHQRLIDKFIILAALLKDLHFCEVIFQW